MGLFDGIVSGLFDLAGTSMENTANKKMQRRAHEFAAGESLKARTFQGEQFDKAMQYNSAESAKQRGWEHAMINNQMGFQQAMRASQYQAAVGDMKKAGLNPMLAYSQGGAGTPTGSSGHGSAASVSAPGGAAAASATPIKLKGYGGAIQTAFQMARMGEEVKNLAATNSNIEAQTEFIRAQEAKARQETLTSGASADKIRAEIDKMKDEVRHLVASTYEKWSAGDRNMQEQITSKARQKLHEAETALKKGHLGLLPAQRALLDAQAILEENRVPRSENEKRAQSSWWMRTVAPYLPDFAKSASSAASLKGALSW